MSTGRFRPRTEARVYLPPETVWSELGQPGVVGHVLREVGQQHGHVEPNGLGGLVVSLLEGSVVNLPFMILLRAGYQELNLLPVRGELGI